MVLGQTMIDLRFSNVDPPEPEPPKTIYCDLLNLPDPIELGVCVRIFNMDDIGLYMQLTGSHANWTINTINLGLQLSGTNKYYPGYYDPQLAFGSRAKPAAETTEVISITLNAYTDGGYSNLKWTMTRNITVFIVKSDDGTWSLDENDNFDDGTVQGWAADTIPNPPARFAVAKDFVLSPPWSLKADNNRPNAISTALWLYKSFTTSDKDHVLAVADIRFHSTMGWLERFAFRIYVDGVLTVYPISTSMSFRLQFWHRFVFPLPRDSTVEIKLRFYGHTSGWPWRLYMWMDDFKIISKD